MKKSEIHALSAGDLVKQLEAAHKNLLEIRIKIATKQLVNTRELRRVRKDIARIKTAMREKELGAAR